MLHFFVPVSLNDSLTRNRGAKAKAKKPMQPEQVTYAYLFTQMAEHAQTKGLSTQDLSNLESAMRAFMTEHGFKSDTPIGSNLRTSYYRRLGEHVETLVQEGRSSRYIANRKHLLGRWHSLINSIDRQFACDSGTLSPFQQLIKELVATAPSQKRLAIDSGVPLATLKRWMSGALPQKNATSKLRRLEHYFGLEKGALVNIAGNDTEKPINTETTPVDIEYRIRLSKARKIPFALNQISESLKAEWRDFLHHKVEILPLLERQPKGRWRATEHFTKPESPELWYCFYESSYVPTASINWVRLRSYLGWLSFNHSAGGYGLPPDQTQSLSWLLSPKHLQGYVSWYVKRSSSKVHNGVFGFVKFVCSVTHPVTGYLTQSPTLASTLSIHAEIADWATACARTHAWSQKTLKLLAPQKKISRNPFEPIKEILELPNPMRAVTDMVRRMKAARPQTGGLTEAIWARDILLIKLLASNPLRAKNMVLLTYRTDNTGELFQTRDGAWRIFIAPEKLKNQDGAAKDTPYDMPIHETVWGDIERYLKRYRQQFPNANSLDYVFLSSESKAHPDSWESLNRRVFKLSKVYLWPYKGSGPHAFRYINGTAILKAQPGAWSLAAQVLHDREETVKAHYAHLRGCDGAERAHALMNNEFAGM